MLDVWASWATLLAAQKEKAPSTRLGGPRLDIQFYGADLPSCRYVTHVQHKLSIAGRKKPSPVFALEIALTPCTNGTRKLASTVNPAPGERGQGNPLHAWSSPNCVPTAHLHVGRPRSRTRSDMHNHRSGCELLHARKLLCQSSYCLSKN